jgi:DNA-binding CsgD family transcriptional regulator
MRWVIISIIVFFALAVPLIIIIRVNAGRKAKAEPPDVPGAIAAAMNVSVEPLIKLSPREKEIFYLLLTDISINEIAQKLQISYSGVNFHIQNLYNKLGIQSRTELLVKYRKR